MPSAAPINRGRRWIYIWEKGSTNRESHHGWNSCIFLGDKGRVGVRREKGVEGNLWLCCGILKEFEFAFFVCFRYGFGILN